MKRMMVLFLMVFIPFISMGVNNSLKLAPRSVFVLTNSVTVTNSNSELTLIGGNLNGIGSTNIPANFFKPGKKLVIKASGVTSSPVTPGTLNLKIKFGTTIVLATGTITSIASSANNGWQMEATIVCRSTGSSGVFVGAGGITRNTPSTQVAQYWPMVNFPTEGVAVNTTAAIAFDITAQFSIALGSSITMQSMELMQFN